MSVLEIIFTIVAAITLVPFGTVAIECVAAMLSVKTYGGRRQDDERPSAVILVPAHNEVDTVAETIAHLRAHLHEGDQLLVVADNCTDETAAIAREAGATVVERSDEQQRGKGYALAFGIESLRDDPPGVLVIVDADCRVDAGGIDVLVTQVARTGLPAQAAYTMKLPKEPSPRDAVSGFAFLFKNMIRPTGLAVLKLPCLLTGSGMALPWKTIDLVQFQTGDIVEDMRIGVELAMAGAAPMFCPAARVWSSLPGKRMAAYSQRTRWEHGHMLTLLRYVPRLKWRALTRFKPKLFALALELGVPPVSLLVAWLAFVTLACGLLFAFGGSWIPLLLACMAWALLALAVLLGWWHFARQIISLGLLLTVPFYLLWKLPMYAKFLFKPQKRWVRTERERKTQANGSTGP